MKKYDVIVIGAGAAGLGCSGVANRIGLKTLLIEKNENNFGGDCTNFGCVPSKALIHIASHFHHARQANKFGMNAAGKADMKKVLAYIHEKQKIIRDTEDAAALRKGGIDVVIGEAQFSSKETVDVNGDTYLAKIIFLCTGSEPRMVNIDGMDSISVYNNENIFFDCQKLPENLIVIGGGPIGCELGQSFARLGSNVTIVERGDRLLSKELENVSKILQNQFQAEGIQVLTNASVKEFTSGKAIIENKDGSIHSIACDSTLLAIGRIVRTKGMALEKGGIALTDRGRIKVNEFLQSTNKKVYVMGDAAGSYQFSHGAEKMVRQVWRNLIMPVFKKKNKMDDLSWVTFTDPQVAHFGLTEDQLHTAGKKYYRQDQTMDHDDRAIIQEYQFGRMSIWFDDNSNTGQKKLLAGSMVAPQAGELMQELQLAQHAGIPVKKINDRVYPYPVATRINQKTTRGLMEKTITDWKVSLARRAFRLFN